MNRIAGLFLLSALGAVACLGQGITVTSPNGGENWTLGGQRSITWLAQGVSGNVRIVLDRDGAKLGDIAANVPASQQSFLWTVGALAGGGQAPAGGGYRVRIRAMGTELSDSSDADFRLSRDIHFQEQGGHELQPSQEHGQAAGVQPGQGRPADMSGLSGLPDVAITGFEYLPGQHIIRGRLESIGVAPCNGFVRCRLETAEGGCWGGEQRIHVPKDWRDGAFIVTFGPCDFFPAPCGHAFRLTIDPEGPDERPDNNVRDAVFYRFPGMHFMPFPPVRLEFSHGSKRLECSDFVYDASNTITRSDVLNDYNPGTRTAQIRFVVGVRNCGNAGSYGTIPLRLQRDVGAAVEEVFSGAFSRSRLEPGAEGRFEVTVDVPVRPGPYYAQIGPSGETGPGETCTAAFTFADEFFD